MLATIRELRGKLRDLDSQVKQLAGGTPSRDGENANLQVRAATVGKS
jgi:hypothetical protein